MNDQPILFDRLFPETQVSQPYQIFSNEIIGKIQVTGGFMEPFGHGYKNITRKAISRDGTMIARSPGNYNIGFDYTAGFGSNVICMYSGKIVKAGKEGGYGNRIHIKLDIKFHYQAREYDVYQAYAHCSQLFYSQGDRVKQGDAIAIEAGQGVNGPHDYGSHVDLDTYCFIDGERIHLNFELLGQQIEQFRQGDFQLVAKKATVIKAKPIQSSLITNTQDKFEFPTSSEPLQINWIKKSGTHYYFELKEQINGRFNWYAYQPDVEIIEPESKGDRWTIALKNCPTNGCLMATAKAEGIYPPGVTASKEIARRDMANITAARLSSLKNAAAKYNLPIVIALALASRESHLGTALGRGNNKPGWGDHNHGFGILQVDRRYHTIQGSHDPFSQAHIEQALEIFSQYLREIVDKKADWSDSNLLKGACVAYNSGVGNVQTISGMNLGTTGNDYGDDVIARAQYFLSQYQ